MSGEFSAYLSRIELQDNPLSGARNVTRTDWY